MALDIYTQKDILNVLRATHVASEGSASLALDAVSNQTLQAALGAAGTSAERQAVTEELVEMYRRGFYTALSAVALAFGLVPVAHQSRGQDSRAAVRCSPGAEDPLDDLGRLDFAWREARG